MVSKILWSFTKINLLGFGGGNALIPIMHKEFVDKLNIIDDQEFMDIVMISNSLPGPSVTQMASIIGYKASGVKGSIAAIIGCILPISIVFTIIMLLLINFINIDILARVSAPVLVIISASMTSLSVKFYKQLNGLMKPLISIGLITFLSIILTFLNVDSFIIIAAMIVLIFIFVREK